MKLCHYLVQVSCHGRYRNRRQLGRFICLSLPISSLFCRNTLCRAVKFDLRFTHLLCSLSHSHSTAYIAVSLINGLNLSTIVQHTDYYAKAGYLMYNRSSEVDWNAIDILDPLLSYNLPNG